jgi:N-acetylglucosamine-6-phosphate deacetylase
VAEPYDLVVTAGTVITPERTFRDAGVAVRAGVIERVAPRGQLAEVPARERLDSPEGFLTPGLIDLHNQGVLGHDVWDSEPEDYAQWMRGLARFGVTSFQVTTTFERGRFPRVVELTRPYPGGAEALGIYLEGPFISQAKRGAIPPGLVSSPAPDLLEEILDVAEGKLRMMAVAPERPDARAVAERLQNAGVRVAIGHTDATFEETQRFLPFASNVTHCFNAMRGFHHRDPGTVGAVLLAEGLPVELIADGVHVHPAALQLALRLKGVEAVSLVTDAIQAAGLPDGEFRSHRHGETIRIVNGESRLADGTLAGSTLTMDRAVRNMMKFAGSSLAEAVRMATLTPARAAGADDRKGALAPGKDADLALLSEEMLVVATVVGGRVVFRAPQVVEERRRWVR